MFSCTSFCTLGFRILLHWLKRFTHGTCWRTCSAHVIIIYNSKNPSTCSRLHLQGFCFWKHKEPKCMISLETKTKEETYLWGILILKELLTLVNIYRKMKILKTFHLDCFFQKARAILSLKYLFFSELWVLRLCIIVCMDIRVTSALVKSPYPSSANWWFHMFLKYFYLLAQCSIPYGTTHWQTKRVEVVWDAYIYLYMYMHIYAHIGAYGHSLYIQCICNMCEYRETQGRVTNSLFIMVLGFFAHVLNIIQIPKQN